MTGIETEYGILIRGADDPGSLLASRLLLQHCEEGGKLVENIKDSIAKKNRSIQESASNVFAENPDQESIMLGNGSRFYIDHTHPEYSTAEAISPREVIAADKDGEIILERCRRRANLEVLADKKQQIFIYKNNSDQKGASYGCHENYMLKAKTFKELMGSTHATREARQAREKNIEISFLYIGGRENRGEHLAKKIVQIGRGKFYNIKRLPDLPLKALELI